MKVLLPLFFLFFSFSFAQVSSNEPELTHELLEEFIEQGLKNGFYARHHIDNHLSGFHFISSADFKAKFPKLESDHACVALVVDHENRKYERILFVNSKHLEPHRRKNLTAITAHELSHFFGMDHELKIAPDVMNPVISSALELRDEDYTRLFNRLKSIPPAKYMLTVKF